MEYAFAHQSNEMQIEIVLFEINEISSMFSEARTFRLDTIYDFVLANMALLTAQNILQREKKTWPQGAMCLLYLA